MTTAIKAIETRYKGYRFRSRLEARWAVFFNAIGVNWEYEPEGYRLPSGYYLPDFFIRCSSEYKKCLPWPDPGLFVEIKPTTPTIHEMSLIKELSEQTKHNHVVLMGAPGRGHAAKVLQDGQLFFYSKCSQWLSEEQGMIDSLGIVFSTCISYSARHDIIENAIELALSARFEHGETP